jgi:hypothetical protein
MPVGLPVDRRCGMTSIVTTTESPMTEARAAEITEMIRNRVGELDLALAYAYEHRLWELLGHPSWDAYCRAEFDGVLMLRMTKPDRQELHRYLRAAGMSLRAISSATGSSINTVQADVKVVQVYQTDTPAGSPLADVVDVLEGQNLLSMSSEAMPTPATTTTTNVVPIKGRDGKAYPPRQPVTVRRRRPLTDDVLKSTMEISKATDRLGRVRADDRFKANRDAITQMARGSIVRATKELLEMLVMLDEGTFHEGDALICLETLWTR